MLIEFSIKNFKSFNEEQTFSMKSSPEVRQDYSTVNIASLELNLLKTCAIFGHNASGKTNFVRALEFVKYLVLESHKFRSNQPIEGLDSFKLQEYPHQPTSFTITFMNNEILFTYAVELVKKAITAERLSYSAEGKEIYIFKRENDRIHWLCEDNKDKEALFNEMTLKNNLFLSIPAAQKNPHIASVIEWFQDKLLFIQGNRIGINQDVLKEPRKKSRLLNYLKFADLGIVDIHVEEKDISDKDINFFKSLYNQFKMHVTEDEKSKPSFEEFIKNIKSIDFSIFHQGENNTRIPFKLDDESKGTIRFLSFVSHFLDIFENIPGCCIIIDELDAALHYLLCKNLIQLFYDDDLNKSNAQLIFTTHNLMFLSNQNQLLHPDQICFAEKSPKTGATELFYLADFDDVSMETLLEDYLDGTYGAIPNINNTSLLQMNPSTEIYKLIESIHNKCEEKK